MNVIISVGGKFHAFHLARALQKQGYLKKIITSYPLFKLKQEGIPKNQIASIFFPRLIYEVINRTPLRKFLSQDFWHAWLFERLSCHHIEPCDIFVVWSGFGLSQIKKAKKLGAVAILERGSSHIVFQKEILEGELKKFDLKETLVDPRILKKELKEYEEADYISVPSEFVKKTFIEKGVPEEKIIKVPYGVDLKDFRQVPKKDKIFRVLFVGGLSTGKGLHYLLEAFSELDLKNSELMLVGSLRDETIKPFLKKYQGFYNYIGTVSHNNLYKYYSNASVFVLPSLQEGFGLAIAEAMACGLPVIVSENTGGQELVRDGKDGFIVPVGNIKVLQEKILYFYENEKAGQKMGASAKKHIKKFTWQRYGREMTKTYKQILQSRKK